MFPEKSEASFKLSAEVHIMFSHSVRLPESIFSSGISDGAQPTEPLFHLLFYDLVTKPGERTEAERQ